MDALSNVRLNRRAFVAAGVPPPAPTVGNAIFAAAGLRLRKLPFDLPALDASLSKAALQGTVPGQAA